jgi:hypothetical protein
MSVVIELVALLLPPVVVPPLISLAAPVVNVSGEVPTAVGVPVTLQVMMPPIDTVPAVGTVGEQTAVKPAGSPAMAQLVPMLAGAVAAGAVLVQVKVPLNGAPTVAVAGMPAKEGTMSDPVVVIAPVTVLLPPAVLPPLASLAAPVVTVSGALPTAVGVPVTLQVMMPPIATVPNVGTVGEQAATKPAGSPAIAQLVPMLAGAVAAGAVLVQV